MCEQIKSLDIKQRNCRLVEKLPKDILDRVISIVFAEIET
jgi:mRNA interferase MazF